MDPSHSDLNPVADRRCFLKRATAVSAAVGAALVPAAASLRFLLAPRSPASPGVVPAIKVAPLSALPADGLPRRFQVWAARTDAWTTYPAAPLGAVFLRRTAEDKLEAFNAACPHAGCLVSFDPVRRGYLCPCHQSTFALDGSIDDPRSPSPRPLDALEVELRAGEVWVRFQHFRTGHARKLGVA